MEQVVSNTGIYEMSCTESTEAALLSFHTMKGEWISMEEKEKKYEPPMMQVFRFDDTEKILTASGGGNTPTPDFAANALNQLFGGKNTTIE